MRILALSMVLALGTLAGTALPAGTACAQASQTISDARLGFTAKLPGTPIKTVTPGKPGEVLLNIYNWSVDAGTAAYTIGVLEFEAGSLSTLELMPLLGSGIDGGIQAIGGTETGRKPTTLAGEQALEATFTATVSGMPIIGRIVVIRRGDLIYSVMTLEQPGSSEAIYRRLMADFKLT